MGIDVVKHLAVLDLITDERARQTGKIEAGQIPWDCASNTVADDAKLAVLAEEFGEVARAILERDPGAMRVELVQVAAVAVAWLEATQT